MWKRAKYQIPYRMKRSTNNTVYVLVMLMLSACGSDKKEQVVVKPEQVIADAKEVISVGKILPKAGIISLSATTTGNIEKIYVKAGDSVKKGALIVQLRASEEQLAASESRAQVASQAARNAADVYEVRLAEIKLQELYKTYLTSKALAEKGAETQEVLSTDYTNYQQQQQKLQQAKQTVRANARALEEVKQRQQISTLNVADRQIMSPAAGVMLSMDARQGQTLQANNVFAELAPAGELVAECEVDVLYASMIKLGQRVLIYPASGAAPLAEGTISFVGASLQNKSILYDKIGEGTDRRVLRITVVIIKSQRPLLINDKVECKIQLN
jgi:multidrug efflux pump subunit AcrA (membrane-fusion protein)